MTPDLAHLASAVGGTDRPIADDDGVGPKVSFIVPCFKLAHLLHECVSSILQQSYRRFEILIMDDCSPDNTEQVSRSFDDERIHYIRNDANLGHLRNYNKGLSLATGEYIWLISADDRLRDPHVLELYLDLMGRNPRVGYAFCSGMAIEKGQETRIIDWASPAQSDQIFCGRVLVRRLIDSNCVLAPSVMVRRTCFDEVGDFPLDLPYAGDWFLWCVMALRWDVAYFAAPMVNYRLHDKALTNTLIDTSISVLADDELKVRWRVRAHCLAVGDRQLARFCEDRIVADYVTNLTTRRYRGTRTFAGTNNKHRMSVSAFEASLALHAMRRSSRWWIRARVVLGVAKRLLALGLAGLRHWPRDASRLAAGAPGGGPAWFRLSRHAAGSMVTRSGRDHPP